MADQHTAVSGRITHVFAHRFVVDTAKGALLADITPRGHAQIALRIGDAVTLEGEMKPSELKVFRLTRGTTIIDFAHDKKHHHKHHDADPGIVLASARAAGFEPLGEPRRKPKHFEVLGRRQGALAELHIALDGHIRKTKAVEKGDPKWGKRCGWAEVPDRASAGPGDRASLPSSDPALATFRPPGCCVLNST